MIIIVQIIIAGIALFCLWEIATVSPKKKGELAVPWILLIAATGASLYLLHKDFLFIGGVWVASLASILTHTVVYGTAIIICGVYFFRPE